MKKFLLNFLWVLLLIGSQAYAQGPVSGRVTGKDDGLPLAGVSVTAKGTKVGTQTGPDGRFTINVQSGTTLVFSYIGFITQEASASANLNIAMLSAPNQLNDVIAVPYGTAKRETFVGSAASITSKDLTNRPVSNPLSALAGVAPGVQVNPAIGQPGAAPVIRVRGIGSVNASNAPLIILDGVQYEGTVSNINAEDIENITVLKDASSTALYGAKAANGVIMINTKRGKKGANQVNIKATAGLMYRGVPEYDRLDAYQYYPMAWQAYRNALLSANPTLTRAQASVLASGQGTIDPLTNTQLPPTGSGIAATTRFPSISQTLGSLNNGNLITQSNNPFNVPANQIVDVNGVINPNAQLRYDDLDWLAAVRQPSNRQDYTLSYNGANEKTDYYVSVGYVNEKGFTVKSDFDRLTARLNVNTQATKWFKTGVNMSGAVSSSNTLTSGGSSYINPFFFSRSIGPVYSVYAHNPATGEYLYDALGQKVYDTGALANLGVPLRPAGANGGRHVLQELLLNDVSFKRNIFSTRVYGEVSFLKHFKFTTNLSADYQSVYNSSYQNQLVGDGAPGGRTSRTANFNTYYNLNELLDYSQTFDKHNFKILAGHENYTRLFDGLSAGRNTQLLAGNTELVNFTTISSATSSKDRDRYEGYIGRFNYDYDQKYILEASIRRDGSSRFSRDSRWGTFGSGGIGWRIDREDFLRNISWIDLLKLRSSYGAVGNYQTDGLYPYQSLYDIANNGAEPGYLQSTTVGNPNLKWEVNKQLDVAIEFGFFKNRLSGSIEAFDRRSSNLLFNVPLPVSSGVSIQTQNIGEMYNKGIELNLAGDAIRGKNFSWNINFNATSIKNRITKMPVETPFIVSGINRLEKDHSIYDQYTRIFAGVDPSDGSTLYVPQEGATGASIRTINGVQYTIDQNLAIQQYTGKSAFPKVYGALTNTFNYKDFSFSFLVNYQLGGTVYDSQYQSLMSVASYGGAMHSDILKSWMNPGDVTDIPRIDNLRSTALNATSTRWMKSASYAYFRNATLNYTVPKKLLAKLNVKNARIFVSGENILLISARKGLDPTQSFSGTVDYAYPQQRILSLGLNVAL